MEVPERPDIDPDELIIKAEYFLPIEIDESNLRTIKQEFGLILRQKGYRQTDVETRILGPSHRTMTFRYNFDEPEKPLSWRLKDFFGISSKDALQQLYEDHVFAQLRRRREDLPFEFDLRFRSSELEGTEGYYTFVTIIPTLLQQYRARLLSPSSDFDVQTTVRTSKREIEKIFDKIEAHQVRRPYTEAEVIAPTLNDTQREHLATTDYGQTALEYIEEADKCLQHNLFRSALNCYVLGIEWVIISHLERDHDRDVVSNELDNPDDPDMGYMNLVDLLMSHSDIPQKTYSKLKSINYAERRWIAHHKSGSLTESEVVNIKDRLQILIQEINTNSNLN